jgi:hypothetical protein
MMVVDVGDISMAHTLIEAEEKEFLNVLRVRTCSIYSHPNPFPQERNVLDLRKDQFVSFSMCDWNKEIIIKKNVKDPRIQIHQQNYN